MNLGRSRIGIPLASVLAIAVANENISSMRDVFRSHADKILSQIDQGGVSPTPVGHYHFCDALPRDRSCSKSYEDSIIPENTDILKSQLRSTFHNVQENISPIEDIEKWGISELWSYPDFEGDCEDYMLLWRHLLGEKKIPDFSLRLMIVRDKNNQGHAVLGVIVNNGIYMLDNMQDDIIFAPNLQELSNITGYETLKISSNTGRNHWYAIKFQPEQL